MLGCSTGLNNDIFKAKPNNVYDLGAVAFLNRFFSRAFGFTLSFIDSAINNARSIRLTCGFGFASGFIDARPVRRAFGFAFRLNCT